MELYNEFKCLAGGYYGILNMDEYDLKVYILKDIENYIKDFIETNDLKINYKEEMRKIDAELSLKTKLQDALIVLQKIDAPIELVIMVKKKIKEISEEEQKEFKS